MTFHNMNNTRVRGVQAMGNSLNADSVFQQLSVSIEGFKRKHESELAAQGREIDALNAKIAALGIGGAGDNDGGNASNAVDRRVMAAVGDFIRLGDPQAMMAIAPSAAMSSESGPDGGYMVPKEIDKVIHNLAIAISPMRGLAHHVSVGTSDYKKIVNRRGATTGWVGESDPRTETGTPFLGELSPPMGEIYAYPSVTKWMLDDSQFNLETFIAENIVDEFALQEGSAFFNGDGMNKPRGLLTFPKSEQGDADRPFGTHQFIKSGAAGGFAATDPADKLIDLVYSVAPAYRAGPSVGWLMNSSTAGTVRKFKDGEGNYLWQNSMVQGQPALLCGYPVFEAEDMPDVGPDQFPIAFGNIQKGYMIVDRTGTSILRDPYNKPGWVRFYITKRVGGMPVDTCAVKFLKIAA